ncbi:MAG: cytochrome c [Deltaproteobacteria bacterium]|nr:cytochrome c [Deltaproteobacteria bacterium]
MRRASLLALFLFAACGPKPFVPTDKIATLDRLDDVMHVQARDADPWFKKIGQAQYADADWEALATVALRMQTTAAKSKSFSRGQSFDVLADRLAKDGADLAAAVSTKEAPAVNAALEKMRGTCRACHKEFK